MSVGGKEEYLLLQDDTSDDQVGGRASVIALTERKSVAEAETHSSSGSDKDEAGDHVTALGSGPSYQPLGAGESKRVSRVTASGRSSRVGDDALYGFGFGEQLEDPNENYGEHGHVTVEDTDAWWLHKRVAERPCFWFWFLLFLYVATWIILIPIVVHFGNDAIYLTTSVPMYMRKHTTRKNQDALKAAWDEADMSLQSEIGRVPQETRADAELKLVFVAKKKKEGHGVLKEGFLSHIQEVVDKVTSTKKYDAHCQLVYEDTGNADSPSKCHRPLSVTHFFSPSYFKGAVNDTYDMEPTYRNTMAFARPSLIFNSTADVTDMDFTADNIRSISEYWAEYGEGTIPNGSEYGKGYYEGDEMQATFYFLTQEKGGSTENELVNMFEQVVDTDFGETPYDLTATAGLVVFNFGYPIKGYDSDSDDTDKQDEDISEWAYDNLNDYFFHINEKYKSHMTMRWMVGTMDDFYLDDILVQDMSLLMATIFCVWAYTTYSLGSFFLGCMGMLMIFLNFAAALLLYRGITGIKYFGTLNMLSIFIILSIGANDIFVLCDSWGQTRASAPNGRMDKRMTHTLKHAAKVMFTTSISTIFSFIGNTTSVFPAVYTFGAFAAWLVWVNYCGVVIFYPSVLAIHEIYFYTPTARVGLCVNKACVDNEWPKCCRKNFKERKPSQQRRMTRAKTRRTVIAEGGDDKGLADVDRRPIDLWFENRLFILIMTWRKTILTGFMAFFIVFLVLATQLVPDPDPPQFYPDGNNYYEFDYALLDYFGSADNLRLTQALVFGVDRIDRKGTDPAIWEDIGDVVWDRDFAFSSHNEQLFIAQLCDDVMCQYSEGYRCRFGHEWDPLRIDRPELDNQLDVMRCFMREFRTWVYDDSDARPNRSEVQSVLETNNLTQYYSASDYDNCTWGVFPVDGELCFNLLFGYIWIPDDLPTSNPDYQPGMSNYDYWKDYLAAGEWEDDDTRIDGQSGAVRFFVIEVDLDAYSDTDYRDGIKLWHRWHKWFITYWTEGRSGDISDDQYGNEFVSPVPSRLKSAKQTDTAAVYSYYFLQKRIIYESLSGIGTSLSLAFCVLVIATGNWIIAILSITVIAQLVICIIGFTVLSGYKLGVMEAIIFVMVVGMVVDYVVHCSEAYLNATARDRYTRSKSMLGLVGASILSGSLSTVVGVVWMLLATIPFFFKFGCAILFQEFTSIAFSLIFFTACLSAFGPEGDDGDVRRDAKRVYAWFKDKCGKGVDVQLDDELDTASVDDVEEADDDKSHSAENTYQPVDIAAITSEQPKD